MQDSQTARTQQQEHEQPPVRALHTRPAVAAATAALMALAWLAGIALQLQQPDLQAPSSRVLTALLATVAMALGIWGWRAHHRVWAIVWLTLAASALAFASTDQRAAWRLAGALNPALEGEDIQVTGVISDLPRLGPQGTRFVLETESATLRGRPVQLPERLSLGWYRSADDESAIATPQPELRAGQRWRLTVRLRAPHGTLNPGGFDVELWLFEQGIAAGGSVRARASPADQQPAVKLNEFAGYPIARARQHIRDAVLARVADPDAAGVLAALAIGNQAAIDREGWDLFRVTGVAHLMSISGLHVTMFAWIAGLAVGWLWRRSPRLMLALPAPRAGLWAGWIAATAYALLAGWGVPAQRTVCMIGTVVLLRTLGLRWPLHAVLLAAAWVVALMDPWALMQPGFWLSFGAVALLVASEPVQLAGAQAPAERRTSRAWRAMRGALRTQVVATVGLAPLSLVFFQQISLVGFVANLVAIPLVTLLVTPLALLGIVLPPLWQPAAALVQGLSAFLQLLAGLPTAQWQAAAAPPWAVAAGLLAALLAVLPLPWRLRLLALPLVLPLLAPVVPRPPPGQFELVAADVGQGTAVLVRTQGHLLLFDTGPQTSPEVDAGSRVLLPLLRVRGERRIDALVLSHRDSDHVGGAAAILAGLPVAQLRSSLVDEHPLLAQAQQRGVPHQRCVAGQSWVWEGVHFEFLHPLQADHERASKPNALSCVLRVQGQDRSALLTGDIEAAQEAALLQRAPDLLRSDVLQVPHHGSRTSSTAAFIAAVAPQTALVQAGYRSRYGHPAPDVVLRYTERGIAVVRSDNCGAWTLPAEPLAGLANESAARCERQVARRYWHHRAASAAAAGP